jgi:hypothetical protein
MKTISKMGISTIQSFCGAQIFEQAKALLRSRAGRAGASQRLGDNEIVETWDAQPQRACGFGQRHTSPASTRIAFIRTAVCVLPSLRRPRGHAGLLAQTPGLGERNPPTSATGTGTVAWRRRSFAANATAGSVINNAPAGAPHMTPAREPCRC